MRKYSLGEIDRMREAIRRKNVSLLPARIGVGPDGLDPVARAAFERRDVVSERELRTYMLGGVSAEELEAKYPENQPGSLATAGEQHNAHVEAYDREMSWRSDQYWLSNGGSVVTECGTILHGDEM